MTKPTFAVGALTFCVVSGALLGTVLAAPPADKAACYKLSFSLAERASKAKLEKDAAASVDTLVARMEGECKAGDMAKADTTAAEIDKALPKKK